MIHADRTKPLQQFVDFVKRNRPNDWNADFTRKVPDLYQACRDELLHCQSDMSAYTEVPLQADGNIHIDHFKKRSITDFQNLTFRWDNLVVDERDNHDYGAGYKDDQVKNAADYRLLINPIDPNPERYFTYLTNGKIIPARDLDETDRQKAEYTIATFNLNHPALINKRSEMIDDVHAYISNGFTGDETIHYLQSSGFATVIQYALAKLLQ